MAIPFKLKRSAVSGKRPELSDLQLGELALNFYDGYLFATRETNGVGIADTVSLLTPWTENYGGASIFYEQSVGIGTTSPTETLTVFGSAYVSENFNTKTLFSSTITSNNGIFTSFNVLGISTFGGNVDINASLDVDGHTELDELNVAGVSTFASDLDINAAIDVDGHTELDELNVSGISTFASDLDINAAIDVDGHTELDELNVAGVATFASAIDANGGLDVFGQTEIDDLNVTGIATIQNLDVQGEFDVYDSTATFHNNLFIAGNLSIGGTTTVLLAEDLFVIDKTIVLGITTDSLNVDIANDNSANGGGISIASTEGNPLVSLQAVGVNSLPNTHKKLLWSRAGTYGVGTTDAWLFNYAVGIGSTLVPTNVRLAVGEVQITDDTVKAPQLSISGVSTFSGNIDANGNLDVDGFTELDELNVTGISTFSGDVDINAAIDVDGHTELDELNVSGVSTFAGNIDANGNLDVDGHTELDQLNVSGVSTFTSDLDINAAIDVDGHTELDELNVTGVSTFSGNLDINAAIDVDGHTELDELNVSGVSTFVGITTVQSTLFTNQLSVAGVSTFQGNVFLGENDKIVLGASNDLQIWHSGSNSIIQDSGVGNLFIQGGNSVKITDTSANEMAVFNDGGSVELYYDNSKKFETTGYGVTVFGGLLVSGITTYTDTTDNTLGDADTGAFQIDGGLGVNKNVTVGGNLNVQGYSEFIGVATFRGGTINIGDANTDNVNIGGEFISNLVPNDDDSYDIGITTQRWRNGIFSGIVTTTNLYASGITTTGLLDIGIGGTIFTSIESGFIGINSTTPTTTLDVGGTINSNTDITINGTSVLTTATNDAVALAIALG
jgi:mannose/fructose/N-acetylgalactosamine-specific phosphotransferase system component IIB